ncbi:MAG: glycosyl transferase family 1, partial [Acidobacteria bacterium]
MRIVFLNPTAQIGGAERALLDLMSSLQQAQPTWRLHLITGDSGPLVDACKAIGVPAHVAQLPNELARLGDAGAGGPAGRELSKAVL